MSHCAPCFTVPRSPELPKNRVGKRKNRVSNRLRGPKSPRVTAAGVTAAYYKLYITRHRYRGGVQHRSLVIYRARGYPTYVPIIIIIIIINIGRGHRGERWRAAAGRRRRRRRRRWRPGGGRPAKALYRAPPLAISDDLGGLRAGGDGRACVRPRVLRSVRGRRRGPVEFRPPVRRHALRLTPAATASPALRNAVQSRQAERARRDCLQLLQAPRSTRHDHEIPAARVYHVTCN